VVCAATFMLLLDITIVNVALPSMQAALHASFSDLQWVVDAYSLALATIVLNAGSLADRYGRKKLFIIGIVIFTISSAVCGATTGPTMLIAARAVQGIGGGIMFATSLSLLAQDFHGKDRGVAFGVWGAVLGAAVAVGPLAGGLLTNYLDWRWIFYVNLPIGIITVAISLWKLKESRNEKETKTDWAGVVLLSGTLFCLVYGLIQANTWGWSSTGIISLFAASAILLVIFLAVETYKKFPILPLKLFTKPSFTGAQIAAVGVSASIFALFLYITLYFQDILGYSALQAGVRFLPVTAVAFVIAAISGRLTSKIPGKWMIGVALLLVSAGLAMAHGVTVTSSWTHLLPGLIVCGFGIGMINPSLANVAIGVVPPQESGTASGVNNTFRQIGIAGGIAVLGAIFETSINHSLSNSSLSSYFSANQLKQTVSAVSGGESSSVLHSIPLKYQATFSQITHQSFITGFNDLLVVTALIALAGAIFSFALIRKRDMAVYEH
jgi:EmrB/QacA subfamily drug resistance transporter